MLFIPSKIKNEIVDIIVTSCVGVALVCVREIQKGWILIRFFLIKHFYNSIILWQKVS